MTAADGGEGRGVRVVLPKVPDVKPDELRALRKIAYSWRLLGHGYFPLGLALIRRLDRKGLTHVNTWKGGGHRLTRRGRDVLEVARIREGRSYENRRPFEEFEDD